MPFSTTGGNPANAGVARLCGISPCPVPDTATALPNRAFYQLNYTRIFSFCYYTTPQAKIKVFSDCGHLCGQSGFWPSFEANKNPTSARVARGSGLWLYPSWMKSTTHPKQARYQLRYTRLFSLFIRLGVFSQTNCGTRQVPVVIQRNISKKSHACRCYDDV